MECGVGWRARGRTALKAEHGRSERAPPLTVGERLPRGGRGRAGEVRGRPGRLCELGRKGGGGPLRKIKMIFILFLK